ncbi:MAG: MFS transporter [Candidatus Obscuribacterales bacterium]|nr:MFS transporter [Candidatus Obscuribacterales bacterium]
MSENKKAISVLTVNTLSFIVCFSCWMMYGVLITFLIDNGLFNFDKGQLGWLIGTPVLTGSIIRLPVGVWTDRYGGRKVFALVMLVSAASAYCVSFCNSYTEFLIAGLGFGLAGTSFAVGIAYTSIWFPKERQGTVLGIFGAGNAGAAITSFGAPHLLAFLTDHGQNLEGWRNMPKVYAGALLVMTIIFWLFSYEKRIEHSQGFTLKQQLAPLKHARVWRFGLYYFFVFGGFVALSQWLIPYYLNVYGMSLATAGLMASIFSLPSGVIRAMGGWLSDLLGARAVMYWVLGSCLAACILLSIPRMDIMSPGEGIMALKKGVVTSITSSSLNVGDKTYKLKPKEGADIITYAKEHEDVLVMPTFTFWQEPVVKVGDSVEKKQLLARGITHIFFQANVWIFTALVIVVGIATGIGKAAVYKHIPDYFPRDIGVVGGIVGVIGGLGGWVGPILFGAILNATGIWTTCWMFFSFVIIICLIWMHWTITHMMNERAPEIAKAIEKETTP